jgi:hypothetical protein
MTAPDSPTKKKRPKRTRPGRRTEASKPSYEGDETEKEKEGSAAPGSTPPTQPTSLGVSGPKAFDAPADPGLAEAMDPGVVTSIWLGGFLMTIVLTAVVGSFFGVAPAVLVLVAATFIAVISLFWSSVRTALGETPLAGADAFAIGAPRQEEEQKRAVLRALKDLEFERTVGKISEEDHRALVAQYRAQAKALLRRIDELSADNRHRAEEIMRERGIVLRHYDETPAADPKPAHEPIENSETAREAGDEEEAGGA